MEEEYLPNLSCEIDKQCSKLIIKQKIKADLKRSFKNSGHECASLRS